MFATSSLTILARTSMSYARLMELVAAALGTERFEVYGLTASQNFALWRAQLAVRIPQWFDLHTALDRRYTYHEDARTELLAVCLVGGAQHIQVVRPYTVTNEWTVRESAADLAGMKPYVFEPDATVTV